MPDTPPTAVARGSQRVLVTDGEERSVVGAVRSLAAAGWHVGVVAGHRAAAAQWSRGCSQRLRLVDPRIDPERFVAGLDAVARDFAYDVLLPGSDAALLAISAHRGLLRSGVRHGLPPHEVVLACMDKGQLAAAAAAVGLATPRSVTCADAAAAREAARAFGFPVIVKPQRSLVVHGGVMRSQGGKRAGDEADLDRLVAAPGTTWLVQAVEDGPIVSCSGVMAGGRLRAMATSRYGRTWPPEGGNAAFATTIAPPAQLGAQVERVLASLGWAGVFELELIERSDGSLVAIDLNPRVFGSMSLVAAAGVPLAALWCGAVLGEPVPATTARPGVRYRWEDGDLRHALWQLRRGRLGSAARTVAPHRGVVHAHGSAKDPLPLAARALYLVDSRLRRLRR